MKLLDHKGKKDALLLAGDMIYYHPQYNLLEIQREIKRGQWGRLKFSMGSGHSDDKLLMGSRMSQGDFFDLVEFAAMTHGLSIRIYKRKEYGKYRCRIIPHELKKSRRRSDS
jgi:hypothetical protein